MKEHIVPENTDNRSASSHKAVNGVEQHIVPFIEGDGIGPEVMTAARSIIDSGVVAAYHNSKSIEWRPLLMGEKAQRHCGSLLPDTTLDAIITAGITLKGPLTTPVGGGIRSLNVALRQRLDLYACVRPIRYFPGVVAPVCQPERVNVVIFRENTEDVYAGIEWERGSPDALRVIQFLNTEMKTSISEDSGLGVKPMSRTASQRLVRMAIQYALAHGRKSVTLIHKGNIMKYTEGAFCSWGYELAQEEFADVIVTEKQLHEKHNSRLPDGKILLNDRIADNMFQQMLLYPERYDVLAMPNLNGDYFSDACAAQVGGLGLAPGANIGDATAVFEATHGTAPDIAGRGIANPSSLVLSGVMMLDHIGWHEAARAVTQALASVIADRRVTPDLAASLPDAKILTTREFAEAVIEAINLITQ